MVEITFWELLAVFSIIWVIIRSKKWVKKDTSVLEEVKMAVLYIYLAAMIRIVNFPMEKVNGKLGTMKFDASKLIPPWINLVPLVHMFDVYDGWIINILGNIFLFTPIGLIWPWCFKKIDNIKKTILAGFGFTLSIEVFQLFFYERCSDVDDLILNTTGAAIGAVIFFGCKKLKSRKQKNIAA